MVETKDYLTNKTRRRAAGNEAAAALADAGFKCGVSYALGSAFKPENQAAIGVQLQLNVAFGTVMSVGASLIRGTLSLIEGANIYAAAVLTRQLVEVDYLSWAFVHSPQVAERWIRSDETERRKFFQPRHLRKMSNGRFLEADYQQHCERGGHPTPASIAVVRSSERQAEIISVDTLFHARSICLYSSSFILNSPSQMEISAFRLNSVRQEIDDLFEADAFIANLRTPGGGTP